MDGLSDFLELLGAGGRKVYVAQNPIDLSDLSKPNDIYVLQLPDGSTAAGGRGGGFGERRIVRLYHYEISEGVVTKAAIIEDDEKLDALDLPYHATAMPVIDLEKKERLVSGVIDPSFAQSYRDVLG